MAHSVTDICKHAGDIFGRKPRIQADPPLVVERTRAAKAATVPPPQARSYRFTPATATCFWCGDDVADPVPTHPVFLCRSVFVSYCEVCTKNSSA